MESCSCLIDCAAVDYEPVSMYEIKIRRAVKAHKCIECKCEINPGESYVWEKWFYDGEWGEYKTCLSCHAIGRSLMCGCHERGRLYFDLYETLEAADADMGDFENELEWMCKTLFDRRTEARRTNQCLEATKR